MDIARANETDAPALAGIATVRRTLWSILLAQIRKTAVAAVSGLDPDGGFINKHRITLL